MLLLSSGALERTIIGTVDGSLWGSNGNHNPEVAPCSLAIVSTSTIANLVDALTQEELIEDPNDFVATHLLALAQNFSVGKAFLLFTRTGLDWTKRFPTIAAWTEGADVRIVTAWWGELARGKMG
jgi:hypothetical protein